MTTLRRCRPQMGTFAEVELVADLDAGELAELSQQIYAELQRLDAKYSFHREDSVLSAINRYAVRAAAIEIDEETAGLLGTALRFSRCSNGLFDICIATSMVRQGALPPHIAPPESPGDWRDLDLHGTRLSFARPLLLDLGGIAKGYAVDCALDRVPEAVDATVNLGGDLRMRHWQDASIALRGPHGRTCAAVPMYAPAVATSIGAPGDHLGVLIDPRSGQPCADPRSYSVFADDALHADALTKLAMLTDDRELLWCAGACALVRLDADAKVECWTAPPCEGRVAAREATTSCH
ncbi:MAG: FAD:protein FMN transferase [Pseudomonadota bacterium]